MHLPELAYWFADQVILLHEGKIVGHGPVQEWMIPEHLSHIYGFPIQTQQLQPQYLAVFPKDLANLRTSLGAAELAQAGFVKNRPLA